MALRRVQSHHDDPDVVTALVLLVCAVCQLGCSFLLSLFATAELLQDPSSDACDLRRRHHIPKNAIRCEDDAQVIRRSSKLSHLWQRSDHLLGSRCPTPVMSFSHFQPQVPNGTRHW
eukprot:CAMPEP_0195641372 /NCGR_PEP_ID=MMETSP0815-20121206/26667_1 /TAXON_ID=97485 /ORGANISM="Prymnesium parvum, Strain Texoma1" /LENGTH=116 /DNA_ID=CAMNT_0040784143 /DNA_START=147 /DNA_END=497 /DNA_ORIENTATION=+